MPHSPAASGQKCYGGKQRGSLPARSPLDGHQVSKGSLDSGESFRLHALGAQRINLTFLTFHRFFGLAFAVHRDARILSR